MYLQHCQTAARLPKSKGPQSHKVPPLTYIAAPFFSIKERKLRTDEKQNTDKRRPISPIGPKRPQSARKHINLNIGKENKNERLFNTLSARTATDVSKLHRKSLNENTANLKHSESEQAELLKEEKYQKNREIRQKLRDLFNEKKDENTVQKQESEISIIDDFSEDDEIFDADDEFEADDEDEDEEDFEEMSKLKQMEVTEKLLREKVDKLKRERLELEESWKQQKAANQHQFTSTTLMENELDKLHKDKPQDSDSEYSSNDGSLDSIMSFSDNNGNITDDSNADQGMKAFANLRKQQS